MKQILRQIVSSQKVVRNRPLNLLGIQLFRILLFRVASAVKRWKSKLPKSQEGQILRQDGIVVIPDFLDQTVFEAVCRDYRACILDDGIKRETDYGIEVVHRAIKSEDIKAYPALGDLLYNERLLAILSELEGQSIELPYILAQHIANSGASTDPQLDLHSDIFFSTYSAFFFIEDASVEAGTFWYARRGHRLTLPRLIFEYYSSWSKTQISSPRIDGWFKKFVGVVDTPVVASRNTMVISNNFGFHRRGQGKNGTKRDCFRFNTRINPLFG